MLEKNNFETKILRSYILHNVHYEEEMKLIITKMIYT